MVDSLCMVVASRENNFSDVAFKFWFQTSKSRGTTTLTQFTATTQVFYTDMHGDNPQAHHAMYFMAPVNHSGLGKHSTI